MDATPAGFADLVVEEHVARSTALHARLENRLEHLTGPLARYAVNSAQLPEVAARAAADAGLGATCTNPFQSIIVRAVEIVFACEEALALVERYEPPDPPSTSVPSGGGHGTGAPSRQLLHALLYLLHPCSRRSHFLATNLKRDNCED